MQAETLRCTTFNQGHVQSGIQQDIHKHAQQTKSQAGCSCIWCLEFPSTCSDSNMDVCSLYFGRYWWSISWHLQPSVHCENLPSFFLFCLFVAPFHKVFWACESKLVSAWKQDRKVPVLVAKGDVANTCCQGNQEELFTAWWSTWTGAEVPPAGVCKKNTQWDTEAIALQNWHFKGKELISYRMEGKVLSRIPCGQALVQIPFVFGMFRRHYATFSLIFLHSVETLQSPGVPASSWSCWLMDNSTVQSFPKIKRKSLCFLFMWGRQGP